MLYSLKFIIIIELRNAPRKIDSHRRIKNPFLRGRAYRVNLHDYIKPAKGAEGDARPSTRSPLFTGEMPPVADFTARERRTGPVVMARYTSGRIKHGGSRGTDKNGKGR